MSTQRLFYLVIDPVGAPVRAIVDHDIKYLKRYVEECREKDKRENRRLPTNYYVFAQTERIKV